MPLVRTEPLAPFPAAAYRGTFASDAPEPVIGAPLPPGWEGLYFPFDIPLAGLRPDGSPARDGILPEVDLPRRMYAGEDVVLHRPLRYGQTVEQTAYAGTVTEKHGRGGRLVFADIVREYRVDDELAVESVWHDVFLEAPEPGAAPRPPRPAAADTTQDARAETAAWEELVSLDERQVFRFSALTFNTHRVHYDLAWAREAEGFDGLLVQGPLTRLLLLDAVLRHAPGITVRSYSFRAEAPLRVGATVTLRGLRRGSDLEALVVDEDDGVLARGRVERNDDR